MKLKDVVTKLNLEVKTGASNLNNEITGGYASDLLSDVLAGADAGNLWITLQTHQNIVAVASMKDLCGIIIINGRQPEEETIKKAITENIPIILSKEPAFELIGKLYNLGLNAVK